MTFSMWAWLSEATPTRGGVSMTSQKADRGFGPGYGPSHSPLAEEQLAEAQWMDYEAFEEQVRPLVQLWTALTYVCIT